MKKKFTPGPWRVKHSETKTAFNVTGTKLGGKYKIARCPYILIGGNPAYNQKEKAEVEANANLMAASPDILESLEQLVQLIHHADFNSAKDVQVIATRLANAEATIAKAYGKEASNG